MEKKVKTNSVKRIALIGPESTGKTTICIRLAEYYQTVWVPEYSRTYMEKLQRDYTYDDIIHCAKEQMKAEDEMFAKTNRFLFCDMELINYKVWFEDKFKKSPDWIEEEITKRKYDLYLLTLPDLSWVADPVRENPERREYFFNLYLQELEKRNFPFRIIYGRDDSRVSLAKNFLDSFFQPLP